MTRINRKGSAKLTVVSDTAYELVREFDAPADLIFRAHTEPELVKRWWGFPSFQWLECTIEPWAGGRWRYSAKEGDMEVSFHGRFQEVVRPGRIVNTEIYEGVPGVTTETEEGGALNTNMITERDGVTTLHVHVECFSPEVLKMILDSGMESGMQLSYDRMEELAFQLAA